MVVSLDSHDIGEASRPLMDSRFCLYSEEVLNWHVFSLLYGGVFFWSVPKRVFV